LYAGGARRDGRHGGNVAAHLEGIRLHELRFDLANECVFSADAGPEFDSELIAARTIKHEFERQPFCKRLNVWAIVYTTSIFRAVDTSAM
jgi:hypothetical protein